MSKRVVVTGMGVISPVGIGVPNFLDGLMSGQSGIARVDGMMDLRDCPAKLGGVVKDFDPTRFMSGKSARRMDRFSQFSVAATRLALQDAGILIEDPDLRRAAIVLGTAVGGFPHGEEQHVKFMERGFGRVDPLLCSRVFYGCATNQVAIELGIQGVVVSLSTGCASSADAIGHAASLIQDSKADIAVCGGSDAPFAPLTFISFYLIGVTSRRLDSTPSPFDADRDGIVIGEGAGVLVLESENHALARGADIYAELAGYATTHDAHHVTQPSPDGGMACLAISKALASGGVRPDQVDHVVAHGCGTPISDPIETRNLKRVFASHTENLTISALESMIGHPLGAVAVIKSISAILSIREGFVFPTINYRTPDPDCDLDCVPNEARPKTVHTAMVNAFSFGGKNSILVFKRWLPS